MQETEFLHLGLTGEEDYESNFENWQATLNGVESSNAQKIDQFAAHIYGRTGEFTLSASEWGAANSQSVEVEELGEDDAIFVTPATREDQDNISAARLFATARKGAVTFNAAIIPLADINIKFFIARGRQ